MHLNKGGADPCRPRKRGSAPQVSRLVYLSLFAYHLSRSYLCALAALADVAKGEMGRLVRHSKGIWDDGGSLLCVRFLFFRPSSAFLQTTPEHC
jgi:hypothetical protein